MAGKDYWQPKRRIETLYETLLRNLLKPIRKAAMKAAKTGDIKKFASVLEKAAKSKLFYKKSNEIAKRIATLEWKGQEKTWKEAARTASKNPEFYESLVKNLQDEKIAKRFEEIVEENAKIIRTLPLDISRDVVKHVARRTVEGSRPETIQKEIVNFFPKHTSAKERLIARTESSKCKAAITQARSESIGVNWAVWRSSDDQRVRPAHAMMDGVLFMYNHPPSPEELAKKAGKYKGKTYGHYGPGNIFNCRCYAQPLIKFTQVKWPAKVYNYKKNKIETMTLEQFKKFGGKEYEF